MKTILLAAAAAAGLTALAVPAAQAGARDATVVKKVITVSCWRGPWTEVIWDRPNGNFVDSLVEAGYDFPTAHAISQRICRDINLVGDKEAMREQMLKALAEAPLN